MVTQYLTATSLDGFIATTDDSLDWLFALGEPEGVGFPEFLAQVGAIAMGSSTYEWILRHATDISPETGSIWPYVQPAWIFSSRALPRIDGADLTFVRGDVRPVHAAMRAAAGGRNIWIAGGGDLAGQFHDAGLLDEFILHVGSATLGAGKPLFPRQLLPPRLQLRGVRALGPGMAELRYAITRATD